MKPKAFGLTVLLTLFGVIGFLMLAGTLSAEGDFAIRLRNPGVSPDDRNCGYAGTFTVTCVLITPAASGVPTTSIPVSGDQPITVVVQITLTDATFMATTLTEFPPEISVDGASYIRTGVTGTLINSNTVVLTATNIALTAPQTELVFSLQINLDGGIKAGYTINALSTTPVMKARQRMPIVVREWCPESVDCYEPNNNFDTARTLSPTLQTITATVSMETDRRDYYLVDFTNDQQFTISLNSITGTGDLDLYVYDSARVQQCRSAFSNNSSETIYINRDPCSASASSAGKKLPKGKYYILVFLFNDNSADINRYKLSITQP